MRCDMRRVMYLVMTALAALVLAGCASKGTMSAEQRQDLYVKALEVAGAHKLLDVQCPAGGCNFERLSLANPYALEQIQLPERAPNVNDALMAISGDLTGLARDLGPIHYMLSLIHI